jgi:hypothetical protein
MAPGAWVGWHSLSLSRDWAQWTLGRAIAVGLTIGVAIGLVTTVL